VADRSDATGQGEIVNAMLGRACSERNCPRKEEGEHCDVQRTGVDGIILGYVVNTQKAIPPIHQRERHFDRSPGFHHVVFGFGSTMPNRGLRK
jgi:hypothetical protein